MKRFGTSALVTVVAIMCQPEYGAKPYWSSRVFHYQFGIWLGEPLEPRRP
jgi:hypothetical protein